MNTYRLLVYLIFDEVKGLSDDFTYTEDHLMFLLDKYRALILKLKYSDIKKLIPESNFQTLCLDLILVPAISGEPCEGGIYLRSKIKIPYVLPLSIPRLTSTDYFQGEFTYISRDRMRYVGNNKWLKNVIYASIAPNLYLYFKSSNPLYIGLEKVRMTGVFEDASGAALIGCTNSAQCLPIDNEFPLEESLIPVVVDMVLKELLGAAYRPKDDTNNSNDDLADMISFLRRNIKSGLQKQIEG